MARNGVVLHRIFVKNQITHTYITDSICVDCYHIFLTQTIKNKPHERSSGQ